MSGQATPLPFTVCVQPAGVSVVSSSEPVRVVRIGIPTTVNAPIQVNTLGIAASSTVVIDSILLSTQCAVTWTVLVVDGTNSEKTYFRVGAMKSVTSGLAHSHYGELGDAIPFTIDVVESAGELELRLTNNALVALDAHVLRSETVAV